MVIVAVQAVVLMIRIFSGSLGSNEGVGLGQAIGQALDSIMDGGLLWIGIATAAGYVMERNNWRPGFMRDWRVKDLPVLRLSDPEAWRQAMAGGNPTAAPTWQPRVGSKSWPGSEALFGVVAGLVFIAWWTGVWAVPGMESMAISGGNALIVPAPIWTTMFVPILLLAMGQVTIDAIGVVRPQWMRLRAGLQAVSSAAGLAVVWTIFHARHWFTLVEDGTSVPVAGDWVQLDFDRLRGLDEVGRDLIGGASTLSLILTWVMVGIMVTLALNIAIQLWRLARGPR